MTTQEFSIEFDILYDNIMSNKAPGLNEYEKSIFLTQAQESLIMDIYTGRYNGGSFEDTEEVTSYLNALVKEINITSGIEASGITEHSTLYQLPSDLWFITYESVTFDDSNLGCKDGSTVIVKPITQDEFYSISRNPFRGAGSNRVLRLMKDSKSEIISKYNIKSYYVRYISKPSPIILEDLTKYGVSINGITDVTECKLSLPSHRIILNRAVQLAKALWSSSNQ